MCLHLSELWTVFIQQDCWLRWWYTVDLVITFGSVTMCNSQMIYICVRIYAGQKIGYAQVAQPKTCHQYTWYRGVWMRGYLSKAALWAYSGTGSGTPLGHTQILCPHNLWHMSWYNKTNNLKKLSLVLNRELIYTILIVSQRSLF